MCVLIFSTTFYEIVLVLRKIRRDIINLRTPSYKLLVILVRFYERRIFSADFRKILTHKISGKSVRYMKNNITLPGKRHPCPQAEYERANPASQRPQAHVLDRAATGMTEVLQWILVTV
jgi:hypothetical protein